MIDSIELGNFKSIESMKIRLAPLTILVGPNGSGKTSVLESIALMAQFSRGNTSLSNSLRGELVDFEDEKTILFRSSEGVKLKLGFSTYVPIDPILRAMRADLNKKQFLTKGGKTYPAPKTAWLDRLKEVIENQRLRHDSDFLARKKLQNRSDSYNLARTRVEYQFAKDFQNKYLFHRYEIAGMFAKYEKTLSSLKTSLGIIHRGQEVSIVEGTSASSPLEEGTLQAFDIGTWGNEVFMPPFGEWNLFSELRKEIIKQMHGVYYLSAQRGNIPWTVDTLQTSTSTWVGSKGEHTLEILSQLMKPENREKWLPYEILLERFGVKSAWSGWKERSVLYSNYVDPLLGSSHKIPSLGFGSKQLIPVVAQLAYSSPGSVILVEEPETSLHPAYQILLPILFANAVLEGKQVIVTTHSSYFPLSLYQVLEGVQLGRQTKKKKKSFHIQLKVDDVAVYHVDRDRNGLTRARILELDKEGLKEGIPSFIEVERKILGRYIGRE
jgi:ABC-type transport system involved in cytochrome c biogenesis ATPase subunit